MVYSNFEPKYVNLLEGFKWEKKKLPEQSCLVDQPGLHKHQLLSPSISLHSPCPLQVFKIEHLYSEKNETIKHTIFREYEVWPNVMGHLKSFSFAL